jgi:glycosyltransferase involved in cell wall biosynthesis
MNSFLNHVPKLSIITVNRNNAPGLRKTIESVFSQRFTDYEYIIIDGGSTDGSVEVIKEFEDKITYWVSEPDKGIYNAMNKGVLKSKGEYLQFLNSGDWLVDDNILRQIFTLDKKADILYGNYIMWYNDIDEKLLSFKDVTVNLQFLYEYSLGHPSSFIKRKLFEGELYDENLTIVSDWKFFLKKIAFDSRSVEYLDYPIAYFNMSGLSESNEMKQMIIKERQEVLLSLFPTMVLSDIRELNNLKKFRPVAHMLEIRKYRQLSLFVFGFIRIALRGYQKLLRLLGCKI